MTKPQFSSVFSYEIRLAVSLPRAWTTVLKQIAKHHYDYKCREAGDCGVINGLHNTACDGEFPSPSGFPVTWGSLDLITKVMEQARYHPDADEVAMAIRQWLRETKNTIEARHAAIVAQFDQEPPCPWTTGGDEHGIGAVGCDRETTYECANAPDTCAVHKSSCCTPKLEPLLMERLDEMSRYARVAFFARLTAAYCPVCGDDRADDDERVAESGDRCQCAKRAAVAAPACRGTYVDFQGADRPCLPGGEGCTLAGCKAAHAPSGGW